MFGFSRPLVRLIVFTLTAAVLLLVFQNTLELRHTAYSCRTISSCIGLSSHRSGEHLQQSSSSGPKEAEAISETTLHDGSIRYDRYMDGGNADLIFIILSRDATSWSSDFRSTSRSIYDLLDLLTTAGINLSRASLALMTSTVAEYTTMKAATARLRFARTTIIWRPESADGVAYQDRHSHDPSIQLSRRASVAKLRNYLMLSALKTERHVVWLDADVAELSHGLVQTMVQHSETNAAAGIITAACHQNQMDNYDKNAWKLANNDSTSASQLYGAIGDEDREQAVSELVNTRYMIPDLIRGTSNDDLVPLDSVGGTVLYIRASLVREGLVFPYTNVVGTTWSQAGWIGVETEGLCYMARGLSGGQCFVLGGNHHARHTDWG